MDDIFREFIEKFLMVFKDDIIVYSESIEEHFEHLETVFEMFRKHELKIKPKSVNFSKRLLIFGTWSE